MWRRYALVALLWVGLSGFMPAAIACAADMPMPAQECCPGHDGCGGGAPTPEQVECCAVEYVTSAVVTSTVEPARRVVVDGGDDEQPPPTFVFASSSHSGRAELPPDLVVRQVDESYLWLSTARLRL